MLHVVLARFVDVDGVVVDEHRHAPGEALDDPPDLLGGGAEEHDRDGGVGWKIGGRHVGPIWRPRG